MLDVIDDFLPEIVYEMLYQKITSKSFNWNVVPTNISENRFSFEHFVDPEKNDDVFEISCIVAALIAEKIGHPTNLQTLLRIRVALIHRDHKQFIHAAHIDQQFPHVSCLLYLNDSDGETHFYADDRKTVIEKITPKKNRLAIFDGNTYHSSSTPVNNQLRYVINFNFGV